MCGSYANPRSDPPISTENAGHETLFLIHIPGNAGGSIRKALGQYGGNHRAYHHQRASKLYQAFANARTKQMFCVIRNPIDRALKSWSWCASQTTWNPLVSQAESNVYSALFASSDPSAFFETVDFDSLVQICHHFTPQSSYLDLDRPIEMISFDGLEAGLDRLVKTYGGERVVLPEKKLHQTSRPTSKSLSASAISRILDYYDDDQHLFENLA